MHIEMSLSEIIHCQFVSFICYLPRFLPTSILGNMGYTVVSPQITAHQAMGLEFLMTFLFVFTFVSSNEASRFASKLVALPIGVTFLVNTLWGVSLVAHLQMFHILVQWSAALWSCDSVESQ